MLIALIGGGLVTVLVMLLGGGDGLERPGVLRERVDAHVSAPERAEQALEQLEAYEALLREELKTRDRLMDTLADELRKPQADREAIETLLDQGSANEGETVKQILALREQLRQSITAEEWPAVFAPQ
jgi:hypothetical protein